jgi:hypothetical protein
MGVQDGLQAEDDPNGERLEAAETTGNWGFGANQAGDAVNENGAENWGARMLAPLSQLSSNFLRCPCGRRLFREKQSVLGSLFFGSANNGCGQHLLSQQVFGGSCRYVIDITCLTKAHALGLASWLVDTCGSRPDVIVAYTRPEQYGTPARHRNQSGRWVDTVLAPFELSPQTFLEKANGIILLGHEGARLSMALAQLLPLNALLFLARTARKEDLQIVTRASNARLLGEVERGERPGWTVQQVDTQDVEAVQTMATGFVTKSLTEERRVVLYPFGPKPLTFATSVAALAVRPSAIWYCYPIPRAYDVDYTVGIGTTEWFLV